MALAIFLVETPSDCCLPGTVLRPRPFVYCVALFPAKSIVTPRTLRHSKFNFVLFCNLLFRFYLIVFGSFVSALLAVSYVVLGPSTGHTVLPLLFFSSCVSGLFSSCLPSGLFVSSFCLVINWTFHRTDRTGNQQSCPLGARPAHCVRVCLLSHSFFSFLFVFDAPFFLCLLTRSLRVYVYTMNMVLVLFRCKW